MWSRSSVARWLPRLFLRWFPLATKYTLPPEMKEHRKMNIDFKGVTLRSWGFGFVRVKWDKTKEAGDVE